MESLSIEYTQQFVAVLFSSGVAILADALGGGITMAFVVWFLALWVNRNTRHTLEDLHEDWPQRSRSRWIAALARDVYATYTNMRSHAIRIERGDDPDYADTLTPARRRGAALLDPSVRIRGKSRAQRASERLEYVMDKMSCRQCVMWADNFGKHATEFPHSLIPGLWAHKRMF